MSDIKKQCFTCAYRESIPGNAHSKCSFDFDRAQIKMPAGDIFGIRSGWYMFPMNYDPVWMIEKCEARSDIKDKNLVRKDDPLTTLFSILGKRFLWVILLI